MTSPTLPTGAPQGAAAAAPTLNYTGKTVLVTGAAGGLGLAFAKAFAALGADLLLADIAYEQAAEQAGLLQGQFPQQLVAAFALDVTQEASCQAAAAQASALASRGRIDALVNNAAIYAGLTRAGFHEIALAEWDRVMAVNLKGPFLMTRAVRPHMLQHGGAVLQIASATVMSGTAQWSHYVSSKAGVIGLTRALATELGPHGIRVNALAPGLTLTEASLNLLPDAPGYGAARGAIRRAGVSDDIVGAALFLCSPLAAFITRQTLVVDGGKQYI